MEDLTYCALHLPLLKLYEFNHPCSDGSAGAELSAWHVMPLAGRPEFNKATSGQNGMEGSAGVDSGEVKAWLSSGRFWLWEWGHGSGPTPPPQAPSHLCAVEPRGRQLLPLIITPNGWIHFLLTSTQCTQMTPLYSRHNLGYTVHSRQIRA